MYVLQRSYLFRNGEDEIGDLLGRGGEHHIEDAGLPDRCQ